MYEVEIHKEALKNLRKSQKKIKERAFKVISHLSDHGTYRLMYPIEPLLGKYKKSKYYEIKIDKDYRIVFRKVKNTFFIRFAGTHNQLRTG